MSREHRLLAMGFLGWATVSGISACGTGDTHSENGEIAHELTVPMQSKPSMPETHMEKGVIVVAEVGDREITLSEIQRHRELHGNALSGEVILERLIEAELLAQEAQKRGLLNAPEVQKIAQKGAVREFLYDAMVNDHGVDNIRDDDYEFWHNQAYQRFVHEDGYFGTDAQFLCCFESDFEVCKTDDAVQTCFDAQEPAIQWVYDRLVERGPYPAKEDFQEAVTTLEREVESAKPLAQININFWHRKDIPYEEQKGYTKLNANLVSAVVDTGVNEFTAPVRSNHGWHITYLYEFLPKKNLKSTDPEAREEISAHIYPLVQKRDFAFLIKKLETTVPMTRKDELLSKLEEDGR